MDSGSVARRYAKALFGLAVERGRVEAWSDALGSLAKVLKGAPDLVETLADPVHTRDERRAVVQKLAETLKLEREPANLLLLLADRNRLDRLRGRAPGLRRAVRRPPRPAPRPPHQRGAARLRTRSTRWPAGSRT